MTWLSPSKKLLSQSNGKATDEPGAIARSALESLALRYRICLGWLESLLGYQLETIHIVGGGVQNKLLCQMTADATNRTVVAGPVEANCARQCTDSVNGDGKLQNFQAAREWMHRSCHVETYHPVAARQWDDAVSKIDWIA